MNYLLFLLPLLVCCTGPALCQPEDCNTVLSAQGVKNAYPRWSADGKSILYQSDASGKWQLCLYDLNTGKSTILTDKSLNANFPDWDTGNGRIAFVSDRSGNEEIYVMDRNGSNMQRITDDPARDIHPYFSPDGLYLLFNSTRGNGSLDVYRYTFATGKTERLTDTGDDETCARYSPDMQHIVYLRNSLDKDDIYLLDTKSFLSQNLTNTPQQRDGWPAFSPDGRWILYSTMDKGAFRLYRCTADGRQHSRIELGNATGDCTRASVTASGKLVYNVDAGNSIAIHTCIARW